MGILRRLFTHRARGPDFDAGAARPPSLPRPFNAISHLAAPRGIAPEPGPTPALVKSRSLVVRLFKRLPVKARIAVAVPLVLLGAAAVDMAGMMVYYTIAFPHPMTMRNKERAPVVRILARDGSVLAERGAAHDFMPLDLLPRHVPAAVVATEDRRFFSHYGVDPVGLVRAFFANLRAGRFAQGGSTLTQQLAKNLFLTHDRTLARKLEEFGLALWLEMRLSKADILELYLNRVYFGGGAYGVEAASQRYFDKSARDLTLAEAAIIAGLLKAPSKYSPTSSPGAARARGRVVLAKMADVGVISRAEEQRALADRVVFDAPKSSVQSGGFDYAVEFVLERLPPLVSGGHAEVVVETTLDADLQRRASEIVAASLDKQGTALGASQGALVVLDPDGGIRALVGGKRYADSQFNRAVKARRQPGSAFKPIVYLAALESGMTPETMAYDLPLTIGQWSPRNDNGQFLGEISLRRALAQSVNTVAVRTIRQVGVRKVIAAAQRLGVQSELRDDPSLALGTSEVSLLEMTGAYAAFGNGGVSVEPHAIKSVRLSSGRVLYAREGSRADQAIDPVIVGQMNDMLNAAVTSGTGRRAALRDHPVAGKTGTTQDFKDAWFIGYTSHLTAGVWVGNDDGKPMLRAVGGGLPAEMWRQAMQVAHDGKAPLALPGTVRRLPAAGRDQTAGWGGPSVPGAPRVEHVRETLPWLTPSTATSPPADSEPPAPLHPQERIDDEFLARILADGPRDAAPDGSTARANGLTALGGFWSLLR
ncbi:MAG: transglycosylase domain-containing protein [Hyphomicrobium sp.]